MLPERSELSFFTTVIINLFRQFLNSDGLFRLEESGENCRVVLIFAVQWQGSPYFSEQMIGYCKSPALSEHQCTLSDEILGNSFWRGMHDIEVAPEL